MNVSDLRQYIKNRSEHVSRKDMIFILGMGAVVALLLLPLLQNLGVSTLLQNAGISIPLAILALFIFFPLGLLCMAFFLTLLPFHHHSAAQLSRYAVIGAFNVALNASIFNVLILLTDISQGNIVTGFAVITFLIVVTQAFFWNVFWTFRTAPPQNRMSQYQRFLAVSSSVAFVNISIIHVLVNVVGAPPGIPGPIWANVALLCTVFTAVLGNFLGYKFFVFKH